MVCLGFKPGVAEWLAQTDPLSYGGTPSRKTSCNGKGNNNNTKLLRPYKRALADTI